MDIIDHIGTVSGIDDAIYSSTDLGTAQKIISLARYLLATNGQPLPGIQTWQYNHPLPYEDGITEDVYHNLFVSIGLDESLQQNFSNTAVSFCRLVMRSHMTRLPYPPILQIRMKRDMDLTRLMMA